MRGNSYRNITASGVVQITHHWDPIGMRLSPLENLLKANFSDPERQGIYS